MALRKVKLYGKLGQLFGKEWNLDVASVGEAIRAIDANTNGRFSEYFFNEGRDKYYRVAVKKKDNLINKNEINAPFGGGDIYIIPTIKGSKRFAQIIVGIVLVVVGVFYENPSLIQLGAALILGGVAQLLAPNPNINNSTEEDQRSSTFFQGNAATVYQGGSVGIVYGRALVAPMPIMLSFNVKDTQTTNNTHDGSVEQVSLPGGGYEYRPVNPY